MAVVLQNKSYKAFHATCPLQVDALLDCPSRFCFALRLLEQTQF